MQLTSFARALLGAAVAGVARAQKTTLGLGFVKIETLASGSSPAFQISATSGFGSNLMAVYDSTNVLKFSITSAGLMTKGSGTFDIQHPLKGDPRERLRHSFVESPLVDNLYTGAVTVAQGDTAIIDLDDKFRMTSGTFEALNFNPRVIATCNGCIAAWGFAGAELSVWCAAHCDDEAQHDITYQVVAERHDPDALMSGMVGPDKHMIPEYTREHS
jgi:hypothetical protein